MRSRVFITQQPKPNAQGWTPNLSPASKFGAIHFIFSGSDHPSADPDGAIFQAAAALEDFRPEADYLLWPNGVDPFSVWAPLIVLIRKNIPVLRGLSWNRTMTEDGRSKTHGYYTPVIFRLAPFSEFPHPIINPTSAKETRESWQNNNNRNRQPSNRKPQHFQSRSPQASTSPVDKAPAPQLHPQQTALKQ